MSKKKDEVIKLLEEGLKGKEIAKRTGYTPSRVSQIKKALENGKENLPTTPDTEIIKSQAPPTPIINDWIEEQLKETMTQCLDNLKEGIKTDQNTVDCIMLIAQLMRYMYDPLNTKPPGLGNSKGIDGGQDTGGATPRSESFMERVERLSGRTGDND